MYKHLVVAVDGSETSLNALKHAAELASVNNARLTLVHVANPIGDFPVDEVRMYIVEAQIRQFLRIDL